MRAHEIRTILDTEAAHLKANNPYAGKALQSFATTATDEELERFREILMTTDRADWVNDPSNPMSTHHY